MSVYAVSGTILTIENEFRKHVYYISAKNETDVVGKTKIRVDNSRMFGVANFEVEDIHKMTDDEIIEAMEFIP